MATEATIEMALAKPHQSAIKVDSTIKGAKATTPMAPAMTPSQFIVLLFSKTFHSKTVVPVLSF
jgi:hypothetical protein